MKICRHCGEGKPLVDFYKHAAMGDGHLNVCKPCIRVQVTHRRRTDPKVQEYDRNRKQRPASIKSSKRWAAENPTKRAAVNAVNNAIRDNRIAKQPCLFCKAKKVEGHHRDYSKPLDVIWLCPRCHRRLHSVFPETVLK